MRYLLDTDICIHLIKKKPERLIKNLIRQDISHVAISSVTLSELEYGVEKSSMRDQAKLALAAFVAPLTVLPYDQLAAPFYGRVRHALEKSGKPIGPLDTMIAAHALSINAVLVTNNHREFSRVAGLSIENWLTQ